MNFIIDKNSVFITEMESQSTNTTPTKLIVTNTNGTAPVSMPHGEKPEKFIGADFKRWQG